MKIITKIFAVIVVVMFCIFAGSPRMRTEELSELYNIYDSLDECVSTDTPIWQQPLPVEEPSTQEPTPSSESTSILPDVDLLSWEMLLVNADNPLPAEYEPPELAYTGDNDCPQDSRIIEALTKFVEAAKEEGLPVYLSSGYRSYSEQQILFQNMVNREGSEEAASKIVAKPGTSEHQTGLSCDITDIYRNPKTHDLEETPTYIWMSQHCHEYGFIVRYPSDKSSITGIIYEPWHFRYVGIEAATYIMENNLCLEEFIELYN